MSFIPQKRSRFAKASKSLPEGEILVEETNDLDYMAPLESLLPEQSPTQQPSNNTSTNNPSKQPKISLKTMMEDNREKGLAIPINETNIGFKLLKKIGYTEGGLGKERNGMIVPVPVTKRSSNDSSGLGILEKKERKQMAISTYQIGKKHYVDRLQRDFIQDKSTAEQQLKYTHDLYKAQKIIYELDEAANVPVHRLTHTLHQHYTDLTTCTTPSSYSCVTKDQGNNENSNHIETSLPLSYSHALSDRLFDSNTTTVQQGQREQQKQQDDEDDIIDSNSNTGIEYKQSILNTYTEEEDKRWQAKYEQEEDGPSLQECLQYMRDQYYYCYYCGAKFNDAEDLEQNCPGLTEEDH